MTLFRILRSLFRQRATDSSAMAAAEFVAATVRDNPVVVFSKTYCPYCVKAKNALSSLGAKFAVVELDIRDDGSAIQDALLDVTGARSVPRVFVGGKFIGGGDDTARLAASGELAPMLKEVGAV